MKTTHLLLLAFVAVLAFQGCLSLQPSSGGGEPSPAQWQLVRLFNNYQLPPQSIPPTKNADVQIERVIQKMETKAADLGLVFDGRQAAEGFVVVGKKGQTGELLLAIAVTNVGGRVAIQDSSKSNGNDFLEVGRMRNRYLQSLK